MEIKMPNLLKTSLCTAVLLSLTACGGSSNNNNNDTLTIDPTNLETLGADFDYEGWLIVEGEPVSTGKFDIEEGRTVPSSFDVDEAYTQNATTFVLTIEPAENDPVEPAPTHILAGNIVSGTPTVITTDHPAAINTDFAAAAGTFILATPTNGNTTPTQGIWYLDPTTPPPVASLTLPILPEGWVYEGWIVDSSGPISTGTFTDVAAADSDGSGPAAGPLPGPAFPGQDFIDPALDLIGTTAVISVEPFPDNSADPFIIKPLAAGVTETNRTLNNIVSENLPSAIVTIED